VVILVVAQRRRRLRALASKAPQPRFTLHAQEFFEAGEFRTPRPLRMEQEIFKQRPRRSLSEITFAAERPASQHSGQLPAQLPGAAAPEGLRSPAAIPIRPSASDGALSKPNATVPSEPAADIGRSIAGPASDQFTSQRIPPQSERSSGLRNSPRPSLASQEAGVAFHRPLRGSGTVGPIRSRHPAY
jgi:hypothetical protein